MPPRPHLLLLPGMALNASIFPAFGAPSLRPCFSDGPGHDGDGMVPYLKAVDEITDSAAWRDASRRVVVGHSFGGMLALSWLLAHGGTGEPPVHGLVLIATTAGPMYDVARVRFGPLRVPAQPLMPLWDNPVVSAISKLIMGGARTDRVDFQRYRHRPELTVGIAGWRETTLRGRRAYRRAMRGLDLRDRLNAVTVPTIVLHGTRDTYFRTPVAEDLARRLPCAELRMVQGARHVPPLTHVDAVRRAVDDLLVA